MKHWLLTLFACALTLHSIAQDPWIIEVENPLQGDYYGITSANGQIGIISSRSPLKIDKLVVGGIYDIYASGRVNNYFPNINPLEVELKVDGQRCERGNIHNYHQSFDMRNRVWFLFPLQVSRNLGYCHIVLIATRYYLNE